MTTPKLPPGAPMDDARLQELRDRQDYSTLAVQRDLIKLVDWLVARLEESELWCARFANDSEAYAAGVEAGRARVRAIVKVNTLTYQRGMSEYTEGVIRGRNDVISEIEAMKSPDLPPHERTVARCRRYEEALRRLATHNVEDGEWPEDVLMRGIAREALEGGS